MNTDRSINNQPKAAETKGTEQTFQQKFVLELKKEMRADFLRISQVIPKWQEWRAKTVDNNIKLGEYLEKLLEQIKIGLSILDGLERNLHLNESMADKLIILWKCTRRRDVEELCESIGKAMQSTAVPLPPIHKKSPTTSEIKNPTISQDFYGKMLSETLELVRIDFNVALLKSIDWVEMDVDVKSNKEYLLKLIAQIKIGLQMLNNTSARITEQQAQKIISLWKCVKNTDADDYFISQAHLFEKLSQVGNNAILNAVSEKKLSSVKLLLEQKSDINEANAITGLSPLGAAIINKDNEMIQFLLNAKADIDQLTKKGNSILHIAVYWKNDRATIELLLKHKAAVNQVNNIGVSTLNVALNVALAKTMPNMDIIELLLKEKADVHHTDNDGGRLPLNIAVNNKDKALMQLLLDYKADMRRDNTTRGLSPLDTAIIGTDMELVTYLLSKNANIHQADKFGDSPLHIAIGTKEQKLVELLLDRKADISQENTVTGMSLLESAVTLKERNMVTFLLEKKADIHHYTKKGNTALQLAVYYRDIETAKLLLESKADVNHQPKNEKGEMFSDPVLLNAVRNKDFEMLKLLLEYKADVTQFNYNQLHALYYAVVLNSPTVLLFLLQQKADINQPGIAGYTALHKAIIDNQFSLVKLLIDNKADVNFESGETKITPLMLAYHNTEIYEYLLANNARRANLQQKTPLSYALLNDCTVDKVDNLLKMGEDHSPLFNEFSAKPHIYNWVDLASKGCLHIAKALYQYKLNEEKKVDVDETTVQSTALHVAVNKSDMDMIHFLLDKKADVNKQDLRGFTPLYIAVRNKNLKVIEILLKQESIDVHVKSQEMRTPLWQVVPGNIAHFKDSLLENKTSIEQSGQTSMQLAIQHKYYDIVDLLLAHDDDPQYILEAAISNQYSLLGAIKNKHYQIAKALLHTKTEKDTMILTASELQVLMKGKWHKKLNGKTDFKFNALHLAVLTGNIKLIESILKNDYNPSHTNDCTFSPKLLAEMIGNTKVIRTLNKYKSLKKATSVAKEVKDSTPETKKSIRIESSVQNILTSLESSSTSSLFKKLKQYNKAAKFDPDMESVVRIILNEQKPLKCSELLTLFESLKILQEQDKIVLTSQQKRSLLKNISGIPAKDITLQDLTRLLNLLHDLDFDVKNKLFIQFLANIFNGRKFTLEALTETLQCLNQLELNSEAMMSFSCDKFLLVAIRQTLEHSTDKEGVSQLFDELFAIDFSKANLKSEGLIKYLLSSTDDTMERLRLCYQWKLNLRECKDEKFNFANEVKRYKIPFDPTIASNAAYYLAHMRYKKDDLTESKDFLISSLLATQHLFHLRVWPLARLGFTKNDFNQPQMNLLDTEFKKNKSFLEKDAKAGTLMLWSLAVMGFSATDEIYKKCFNLFTSAINKDNMESFDTISATQILQAQLWFGFKLEKQCEMYLKNILIEAGVPESSGFHKKGSECLASLLAGAGLPPHKNEVLLGGVLRVDACIEKLKVVIEFDGPEHDPVTDLLKDKLLKRLGYKVIRISYADVNFYQYEQASTFLSENVILPCKFRAKEAITFFDEQSADVLSSEKDKSIINFSLLSNQGTRP